MAGINTQLHGRHDGDGLHSHIVSGCRSSGIQAGNGDWALAESFDGTETSPLIEGSM